MKPQHRYTVGTQPCQNLLRGDADIAALGDGNRRNVHQCPICEGNHLFCGTHQDNVDDMVQKNRHPHGVINGMAKVSPAKVLEIRNELKLGVAQSLIAVKFDISQQLVSRIGLGELWSHI